MEENNKINREREGMLGEIRKKAKRCQLFDFAIVSGYFNRNCLDNYPFI